MLTIIIENSSYCKVLKNEKHWNIIWNILSYKAIVKDFIFKRIKQVTKSEFDRRNGKFGRGLLLYVANTLKEKNIPFYIKKSSEGIIIKQKENITIENIILDKYQKKILEYIKEKNIKRGIIQAPTGSGKSLISAALLKQLNFPKTLILVPTGDIARNTVKEYNKFLNINIGMLGQQEKNLKRITVGLYQTIKKLNLDIFNEKLDCIIVDEAHLATNAINNILKQLPNVYYRYGFTATPIKHNEDTLKWLQVTSQLGEVIIKIEDEEAKSRVTNVEIFMFTFKTVPLYEEYQQVYRNDYLLNKERCKLIAKMSEDILKQRDNCLIIVDELEQAKLIKKQIKDTCFIASSKSNKEDLEKMKQLLTKKQKITIISTPVWGVGTNIPEVEAIIIASIKKSPSNTIQKIGRGRRKIKGKKNLLVYDIFDFGNKKYIEKHSKKRLELYKELKWFKGMKT